VRVEQLPRADHRSAGQERGRDALDEFGSSCTGSRFLNGNLRLHEELESALAAFTGGRRRWCTAYTPIASAVLAVVAMRRGDIVAAREHARELAGQRPALWRGQASWIHALVTGQDQEELPGPAVLVEEPAAAWFVRTALAAGDEDRAAAVLRRMKESVPIKCCLTGGIF
jgi:hypothetical protein